MQVFSLPDDTLRDKNQLDCEIIFYHYTSEKNSFKEKSVLNRNAFSLVISGSKTMHFAEKTVHIEDSEIHILSAGSCLASVNISKSKPFESFLIFFNNEVLRDFYSTYSDLISKLKTGRQEPDAFICFKKDKFIGNFIQSLIVINNSQIPPSDEMKRHKLQELFLYLLENHTDQFLSFENSPEISDAEIRIRKIVEANKENNLTLDELAFLCNVSTSTFKRHFKKIYHSSPAKWINKQRMVLAGRMLNEAKPGDIWYKLGFETQTGFTKSFKKHFGVLPKNYNSELTLRE